MDRQDYAGYLKLNGLLSNQIPLSNGVHDEMLFIIIHQTYELWFKQILHEMKVLKDYFSKSNLQEIFHTLKRIRMIVKILVSQFDVLETMCPDAFASFREYLSGGSGFQSKQFRAIEDGFGMVRESCVKNLENLNSDSTIWLQFLRCYSEFYFEKYKKLEIIENLSECEVLLVSLYYQKSIYTEIAETLLDVDEGFQEWRYRHLKMVERIIGCSTTGTGGTSGCGYLQKTAKMSFCHELWRTRNIIFNLDVGRYFNKNV